MRIGTPGRAPAFWANEGGAGGRALGLVLAPIGAVVGRVTTGRAARPGTVVGVPVLCCGNATVGGAGKTVLALELLDRLRARGFAPHALTRGHGGRVGRAVHRVDPARDAATTVGDEPLLLAMQAPTWVSSNRVAAARAAVASGADALVLDDGLQNPGLAKTASFLLVDGVSGFGNNLVLPAGPLREPAVAAAGRCRAVVLIGPDRTFALRAIRMHRPVLAATLEPDPDLVAGLLGRPLLAFAGIGRPAKFFEGLRAAGLVLVATRGFPDHHRYRPAELDALGREAAAAGAALVTTPKDAVRLPAAFRAEVAVIGVRLAFGDDRLDRVLDAVLAPDEGGA